MLASSTSSRIEINLTQKYVFKSPIPFKEKGTEKPVNSKVTFHLNGAGLIERHDEEYVLSFFWELFLLFDQHRRWGSKVSLTGERVIVTVRTCFATRVSFCLDGFMVLTLKHTGGIMRLISKEMRASWERCRPLGRRRMPSWWRRLCRVILARFEMGIVERKGMALF